MESLSLEELVDATQPEYEFPVLATIDAVDLMNKQLPPPKFVCENLLPVGYTVFGGKPKKGKSMAVLGSIVIPICLGTRAFGVHGVDQGEAVYLGFEESERRTRERLRKFVPMDIPLERLRGKLHLVFSPPRYHENGIEIIERFLDEHRDVKTCVIDTLQRFSPPKRRSDDSYDAEYNTGAQIFRVAQERELAIIGVTHTTKAEYGDIFDSIRGTGTTAAADTVMVFESVRDPAKRVLHIQSRDMREVRYSLSYDESSLLYQNCGELCDNEYKSTTASGGVTGRPKKLNAEMQQKAKMFHELGLTDSAVASKIEEEFAVAVSAKTISRMWTDE